MIRIAYLTHIIALFPFLLAVGCGGPRNPTEAAVDRLPACPDSPNCVSSQSLDSRHRVDPLTMVGGAAHALDTIAEVVMAMPRARVVSRSGNLLAAEFRTPLGFVDDVHFLLDPSAGVIHVRSASRLGYWDLGVNRRRVEAIRARLASRSR